MVAPADADLQRHLRHDGPEANLVLLMVDQTSEWDGMLPRYLNYFPFAATADQMFVSDTLHFTLAVSHAMQELIVRQALEDDQAIHSAADDQLNNGVQAALREISENTSHDLNTVYSTEHQHHGY